MNNNYYIVIMNGLSKRITTIIFFFMLISCKTKNKPEGKISEVNDNDITVVEFHLEHSILVTKYYKVDVEISKRQNGINLHLMTEPNKSDPEWQLSKKDTSFTIKEEVFHHLLSSIRNISTLDLESALEQTGEDGMTCEIKYGNHQNWISYMLLSPGYDFEKRKTKDFLKACREIIVAAGLDPKKIL